MRREERMLVMSRGAGESIVVQTERSTVVMTVTRLDANAPGVTVVLISTDASKPGDLACRTVELDQVGATTKAGDAGEISLVDRREHRARFGVEAPSTASVHRLEVYEALRRRPGDADEGAGGARVPRPTKPLPPSLDKRLDEPQSSEES
jgi:sRNA-binding carbon storage regulator CsrA